MKPFGNLLPREERFLSTLQAWTCASCGEDFLTKEAPGSRLCVGCLSKPRVRGRSEVLAAIGVPARYREPFLEKRPNGRPVVWPKVRGVDSAAWSGVPWACGFTGDSDTGKTFLATELLWRQVQRLGKVSARWSSADAIVDSGFGNGGDRGLWNECLSVRLLLIDDLGRGGREEKLFVLISARHAAKLPTIWTSNHGRAYFVKSPAGEPLARRLCDDGAVFALTERWR